MLPKKMKWLSEFQKHNFWGPLPCSAKKSYTFLKSNFSRPKQRFCDVFVCISTFCIEMHTKEHFWKDEKFLDISLSNGKCGTATERRAAAAAHRRMEKEP